MEHLGSIYMFFLPMETSGPKDTVLVVLNHWQKNRRNGPCHDPFRCHMLPGDGENEAATFKELMGFFGVDI